MQQMTLQRNVYISLMDRARRTQDGRQVNAYIQKVFSHIDVLAESFRLNQSVPANGANHNVDMEFAYRFFYEVMKGYTGDPSIVATSTATVVSRLQQAPQYKNGFPRAYFILLLNPQMFDSSVGGLLDQFCQLLDTVSEENRNLLTQWLVHVDGERIARMVYGIQTELNKVLGVFDQARPHKGQVAAIKGYCRLLEILFRSNQQWIRMSNDIFKNEVVMQKFNPLQQFEAYYKGDKSLCFMYYPFLLTAQYKNKLLEIQTKIEHQDKMQEGLVNMFIGMLRMGEMPVDPLSAMFLHLEVRRANILDESVEKLSGIQSHLKNPLKITFIGESGQDGGGVRKQWFQLIVKEIFNPNRDMFIQKNNKTFHWFNPQSFEPAGTFELVGMIMGLAIYNTTLLDLRFPLILYQKLLAPEGYEFESIVDLAEIQPDFCKSFKFILETKDPLDDLELTFETETQVFGEVIKYELKPGGRKIKVDLNNRHQYVKLYTKWLINKSVEKQFKSFRRGFYKVVTGNIIKLFLPEELERVICGQKVLDFQELQKAVKYEGGFSKNCPFIRALWQVLHGYDLESKKAFLFFSTGTDRAPIGGLSNLKLTIQRQGPDSDILPTAQTCSSVLLLPEYSSREKLKKKLELALKFKEGFGLI